MALKCFSPLGAKLDWLLCCVLCYMVYLSFNQPCRASAGRWPNAGLIGQSLGRCAELAGRFILSVCLVYLYCLYIYVENMKPMMHGMSVMMTLQIILINVLNVMYCTKADLHLVCCLFDNG